MNFRGGILIFIMALWLNAMFVSPAVATPQSQSPEFSRLEINQVKDAQAEFVQAGRYYYGRGTEKDIEKALSLYKQSAAKGHAKSELAVAQVLIYGYKENRRYREALPWLIKASQPHDGPQISGREKAEETANKLLTQLCKKGLVDFPESHSYAQDPKCWLARGNRLFSATVPKGYSSGRSSVTDYKVTKSSVAARLYLERAFEAGEVDAVDYLAKMYRDGLGVPADEEKFLSYLKRASDMGHPKASFYLAEQALEAGDKTEYLSRLQIAADRGHQASARNLAWAYIRGTDVQIDEERALMYFFISGQRQYVRARSPRRGDIRLPFDKNAFLPLFQSENITAILERAHRNALEIANRNAFKSRLISALEKSYNIAKSDAEYFKETGGQWHQSGIWNRLVFYFMFLVLLLLTRSIIAALIRRS
jgi:TPR repeat protein